MDGKDQTMDESSYRKNKGPSMKAYNTKKLREKTSEVNEIMRLIHTTSITETNNLACARARLEVELMGIQAPTPSSQPTQQKPKQQLPWKRLLEKQIMVMRSDLSKLKEMAKKRIRSKKTREALNEKYKVQEKGLNNTIEDIKMRIKAKVRKIQQCMNRNKGYQQNKLFRTNQKRLYSQLRGEDNHQEIPEAEPSKRLLESIWNNPVSHNKHAIWLQEVKAEEMGRIEKRFTEITTDTV
ncbi:uncharacterized protein [Macrobrachium rosenbergii]|uniref:uncharacterized protein n=1 Tax=Macrobrachium rosenbergii TaxID=79674 RepID=UPI0034D57186